MKRPRDGHSDVTRLAGYARLSITVIGSLLALVFTWLQIRDLPIAAVVENTRPEFIQRLTIVIYYLCWIAGSRFDVGVQEAAYVDDPREGRLSVITIFTIILFGAVAAALLWVSDDELKFSLVLTLFVGMNILGWRHIIKRVRPAINATRKRYREEHDYFGIEHLSIVTEYMSGRWQWHRFATLVGIILVSDVVVLMPAVRQFATQNMHRVISEISSQTFSVLLPDFLLLLFVLISEVWMWVMRVRIATSLRVLRSLNRKYNLTLRRGTSPPSPIAPRVHNPDD